MERVCRNCNFEDIPQNKFPCDLCRDGERWEPKGDAVNSPTHYTSGKIEVIDYITDKLSKEEFEGFCIGNVVKYVSRYKHKNGLEDLKKAKWYLEKAIELKGGSL